MNEQAPAPDPDWDPAGDGAEALPARRVLAAVEAAFTAVDAGLARVLPGSWNPLLHTGALATLSLVVALVSGVVVLIWYSPSVHQAYASVQAMGESPWTAGLCRSLHRYSSDATMLFTGLHLLRLTAEGRFTRSRWLAWVTGAVLLGTLWLDGWLGYWLVWDARAQGVALGTARLLDVLPIFTDPMGRSLLVADQVNSLLFFVVFFVHMLLPLILAIALWLHVARLARPDWITRRALTGWALAVMTVLSIAWPATSATPVDLAALSPGFRADGWYLAPLWLTDRLGGGALWAVTLGVGALFVGVPWWWGRPRAAAATVVEGRCNACRTCITDCPYEAISLAPRTDGRALDGVALVDPAACVSCGICAGSCDSAGIGLPALDVLLQRKRLDRWLDAEGATHVAWVCAGGVAAGLRVDPATGVCEALPGWRIVPVPCTGQVQPLSLERALRHGATAVVLAGCADGGCRYREGARWTTERLSGKRRPALRADKVDAGRIHHVQVGTGELRSLAARLAALRGSGPQEGAAAAPSRPVRWAAAAVGLVAAAVTGIGAELPYWSPETADSELVVSFKHPGQVSEDCRAVSEDDQAARPIHMRQAEICERQRADVRLALRIDDEPVLSQTYAPAGLWGDGNSLALERLVVAPGEHNVAIALGDGPDPEAWTYTDSRRLTLEAGRRQVIAFDRMTGFTWTPEAP